MRLRDPPDKTFGARFNGGIARFNGGFVLILFYRRGRMNPRFSVKRYEKIVHESRQGT